MDPRNLFIDAVFVTPDCPDFYGRVAIPNAHDAKNLPRRVTDLSKLSLLPFLDEGCVVMTRSCRDRLPKAVDCLGQVFTAQRGDVVGFVPEHYVRIPTSARCNAHDLLVGKLDGFDFRIFAAKNHATIEFAQIVFPQNAVDTELENVILNKALRLKNGEQVKGFEKTGKSYTYYMTKNKDYKAEEYKIDNRRVAIAQDSPFLAQSVFMVRPIRYAILNYDEMPTHINPNGTGRAKAMHIASVNALLGADFDDMWQFSRLNDYANNQFLNEISDQEQEQ